MATNSTLLCLHRDPTQLGLLEEHGYRLVTAANGHEGLRLFMSRPVDAIVLEYHLGLLDGVTIADEIKQVRPEVPIVMLVDHVDLPSGASNSVDALVAKSDGPHFLLAIVHFVLSVKPTWRHGKRRMVGRPTIWNRQLTTTTRLLHPECGEASGMELSNSDQTRKGSGCETMCTCCCSRRQR